jgi:hypothetical protein
VARGMVIGGCVKRSRLALSNNSPPDDRGN